MAVPTLFNLSMYKIRDICKDVNKLDRVIPISLINNLKEII